MREELASVLATHQTRIATLGLRPDHMLDCRVHCLACVPAVLCHCTTAAGYHASALSKTLTKRSSIIVLLLPCLQ